MSETTKVIKGGYWTGLSTGVTMITQFARIMILTRFLEKSDFGIVSVVNMIIGLCVSFSDLGFSSIIMYKKELSVREYSTLYWIQLILYILVFFIISLFAPIVSNFFGEQVLEIVIPISALSIVCLSFGKLYDSVLQKRYEFKRLAIRNMVSNIISLFLALFLAYHGYGIYSLIYSTLFQYTCYNIWTLIAGYKLQPLKFLFSYGEVKPLIKLGLFQTYTRIADYLSSKIDVIIIGKFLGVELLGIYDLSKELVQKFVMFIRTVVSQIALPFLSNSNNDDEVVKKRFLLITKIVAMICIPICFTIAVFSKEILWIVYGEKYIDAQYIVLVFAVISIATSITSFFDMLGIAKGRTDLNFKNTIYRILITTPIILLASLFSINVLAISQILITTLMVIVFWLTVVKGTYPICFSAYFRQFKNILFVTALVSILFFVAKYCMPSNITENFLINFVIYIVIYFIILLISYIVFLKEDLVFLKNVVLEKNLN